MDTLETTLEQKLADNRRTAKLESDETHKLLKSLLDRVGLPQTDDNSPATGLYWVVSKVSERVTPFERRWEQTKGAAKLFTAMSLPIAALLWFFGGEKLTHFFHG